MDLADLIRISDLNRGRAIHRALATNRLVRYPEQLRNIHQSRAIRSKSFQD